MEKVPKLKEMPAKERVRYLWDYYRWYFLLGLFGIVIVTGIVHSAFGKKNETAYILMVNANTLEDAEAPSALFTEFLQEQGIDPRKNEVNVNTGIQYLDGTSVTDVYGKQALTTILGSGTADICIMPEEMFYQEAGLGAFFPVDAYLTKEEQKKYADRIVWVEKDPDLASIAEGTESEAPGTKYARGIRLPANSLIGQSGLYGERLPVAGIAISSDRAETAALLMEYLLRERPAIRTESIEENSKAAAEVPEQTSD